MKNYQGAMYIGIDPIRLGMNGRIVYSGEIITEIPEWEAKGNSYYKPVYYEDIKEKEEKKKYKGDIE